MRGRTLLLLFVGAVFAASLVKRALADPISEFYQGRAVTLYIGAEPGGGYDLYARGLARDMARYIPGNPTVLPMNMPGGGSMILGDYLAKIAPRDGLAIGVVSPLLLFESLFDGPQSVAQVRGREMTMIGNGASAHWVLLARHAAGIAAIGDLKRKKLIVGTSGRAGAGYILTHAIKKLLGLDGLKIVTGYGGIREIIGAVDRGEISGCVMDLEDVMAVHPQWLSSSNVDVLAQLSPQKMPEASVRAPSVMDYARSDEDKHVLNVILASTTLSRPLIGPPHMPPARVKALRGAFLATLQDPDFLAEAARMRVTPSPTSGEQMEGIVDAAYDMPSTILARMRAILAD